MVITDVIGVELQSFRVVKLHHSLDQVHGGLSRIVFRSKPDYDLDRRLVYSAR
jgi:hypothetical protein